jgi:hypothetical protein
LGWQSRAAFAQIVFDGFNDRQNFVKKHKIMATFAKFKMLSVWQNLSAIIGKIQIECKRIFAQ